MASNVRVIIGVVLSESVIPLEKMSANLTDNGSNMVAAFRGHFQGSSEGEEGGEREEGDRRK